MFAKRQRLDIGASDYGCRAALVQVEPGLILAIPAVTYEDTFPIVAIRVPAFLLVK